MQKKENRALAVQSLNKSLPSARSVLLQPMMKSIPAATERPAPSGEVHKTRQPAIPTEPISQKSRSKKHSGE